MRLVHKANQHATDVHNRMKTEPGYVFDIDQDETCRLLGEVFKEHMEAFLYDRISQDFR